MPNLFSFLSSAPVKFLTLSLILPLCCVGAVAKESVTLPSTTMSANPLSVAGPQAQFAGKPLGLAEGAGIWVNMWSYPKEDFEGYAQNLYSNGVRNLFVQTSRTNTKAITQPRELGALIEACHKYKIRVIAWSFAELVRPEAEANKMIEAARFESPNGERLDAIAPNLEKNLSAKSVETYTLAIRKALGADYPLVAVIFSPLNRGPEVAHTPWKTFGKYYDVIAPMAYWNGKYQTLDAYTYTKATIAKVRELTEKPCIDVHVIGDGMGTHGNEILEFMAALRDGGAQSGSLYPNHYTTPEQFQAVSRYAEYMPANTGERLRTLKGLLTASVVNAPKGFNPANNISRGEFFNVVARGLKIPSVGNAQEAFQYFKKAGVIDVVANEYPEMACDDDLSAGVNHEIADRFIKVARQVVEGEKKRANQKVIKSRSVSPYLVMGRASAGSRADRFFVSPVYAEGDGLLGREARLKGRPLNYFDAANLFSKL